MAEDSTDTKIFGIGGGGGGGSHSVGHKYSAPIETASFAAEYKMNHKQRGVCVLINQKNFDYARTGQVTRDGTDVDASKVEVTFKKLGYEVRPFSNLKAQDIINILYSVSTEDHSERDSFVCVILSHGLEGKIFGYDTCVTIDYITRPFRGDRCKTLVGKPKIFFFQACRGTRFDPGVETDMTDSMVRNNVGDITSNKLPIEADFLLAYSTVPGYYSWRNNQDGSWFIQCLCKVLRQQARQGVELMHMLIDVNRQVATQFESCTDQEWTDGMKQMPSIVCMLTKLMYFHSDKQ